MLVLLLGSGVMRNWATSIHKQDHLQHCITVKSLRLFCVIVLTYKSAGRMLVGQMLKSSFILFCPCALQDVFEGRGRRLSGSLDRTQQFSRLQSMIDCPRPRLPEANIRMWAAELVVALDALHQWGIICRWLLVFTGKGGKETVMNFWMMLVCNFAE